MKPPTDEFLKGSREATRFVFRALFGATDAWIQQGHFYVLFQIQAPHSERPNVIAKIPIDTPLRKLRRTLKNARKSVQGIENFYALFEQMTPPKKNA